ncbi:recombinase family protein [Photobacterium leiognathi]|uniref:hypothetical protein n=1 Tax=Photobacterium leiognathi TaxID=553611 RepID=UPI0029821A31|nr:hypothetical protein [Photobacterium leiognathi]
MFTFDIEHQSGTKLERPELNKLIEDSEAGDVLLIMMAEQQMKHAVFSSREQNSITLVLIEFMLDLGATMAVMITKLAINAKRKALRKQKLKVSIVVVV